jgi:hypothetical protein
MSGTPVEKLQLEGMWGCLVPEVEPPVLIDCKLLINPTQQFGNLFSYYFSLIIT